MQLSHEDMPLSSSSSYYLVDVDAISNLIIENLFNLVNLFLFDIPHFILRERSVVVLWVCIQWIWRKKSREKWWITAQSQCNEWTQGLPQTLVEDVLHWYERFASSSYSFWQTSLQPSCDEACCIKSATAVIITYCELSTEQLCCLILNVALLFVAIQNNKI